MQSKIATEKSNNKGGKTMYNANKSKSNIALYIVLSLIIVAVVCMTVFSVVTNTRKKTDNPKVEETAAQTAKRTEAPETRRPEMTQDPEDTYIEEPEEDVNNVPEDEPSKEVDAPAKLVFTKPVEGYLLKGYDIDMPVYSLTMNDYRVHTGIDILADIGSTVACIAEGTVQNVYDDPMMGNCISISHPNGLVSYYMGLSDEVCEGIEEGAPVYCGQALSSIGDSTLIEIAEEPHLHLEVKKDGKNVNPLDYISYEATSSANAVDDNYEG